MARAELLERLFIKALAKCIRKCRAFSRIVQHLAALGDLNAAPDCFRQGRAFNQFAAGFRQLQLSPEGSNFQQVLPHLRIEILQAGPCLLELFRGGQIQTARRGMVLQIVQHPLPFEILPLIARLDPRKDRLRIDAGIRQCLAKLRNRVVPSKSVCIGNQGSIVGAGLARRRRQTLIFPPPTG